MPTVIYIRSQLTQSNNQLPETCRLYCISINDLSNWSRELERPAERPGATGGAQMSAMPPLFGIPYQQPRIRRIEEA